MPAAIPDTSWVTDHHIVADNGCWIWAGGVCHDGYGKCGYRAGQTLAHRAYYTILVGNIPAGTELDHLCKNRLCVNPDHLEAVTHTENVARGDYKSNHRNARKQACHKGHEFDSANTILERTPGGSIARKCRKCRQERERMRKRRRVAA